MSDTSWTDVAKALIPTLIPIGAGIVGGVLARNSERGAQQDASADLAAAMTHAEQAYSSAFDQAQGVGDWAFGEAQKPLAAGYQQGRSDLLNALDVGSGAIREGQDKVSATLAPYTQAGTRATGQINHLLYGDPKPGMPAPTAPVAQQQTNALAMPSSRFTSVAPATTASVAPPPRPPVQTGAPSGNPGDRAAQVLADNKLSTPGVGPTLAGVGTGLAAGALAGGGIGAIGGAGLGAWAGPIGAGVGALTGILIGRLGRHNREKKDASTAINEVSDWYWKDIVPKAKKENWTPDQLKQVAQAGWRDYGNWLSQNLKDKGIIASSLESQREYFNQGLMKEFGFTI